MRRLEAGASLTAEEARYLYALDPAEFSEIAALIDHGWQIVEDAPICCLVPAAWQPEHRTWVEDRLPRIALHIDANAKVTGASPLEGDEVREMVVRQSRAAGLPPPPEKRLWLVRSPWPGTGVDEILEAAERAAESSPAGPRYDAADVYRALVQIMAEGRRPTL